QALDSVDTELAIARRYPPAPLRAVAAVAQPVEPALSAGEPLDDHLGVGIDEDRHQQRSPATQAAPGRSSAGASSLASVRSTNSTSNLPFMRRPPSLRRCARPRVRPRAW